MIGGGSGAFIGAVHRRAAALDGHFRLVAGALSSTPEQSLASARDIGLPADRAYPSWPAMLEAEIAKPSNERLDAISIVTPNATHFEIARACVSAGFNVICDKPLCTSSTQADELVALAQQHGVVFAVTYNYSGYPLIKQARHLVHSGQLGTIRKVIIEYHQDWLGTPLERSGQKQAAWRTNPAHAGAGGAIGDIGTHAEHLLSYVTGLEIDSLCADLTRFIPGRSLDDDASVLLRFRATAPSALPAKGVLLASQVETGQENNLILRVFGDRAGLEWRHDRPEDLMFTPAGEPTRMLRRGHGSLCDAAKKAARFPPGHPEGFLEAFANVYAHAAVAIRARASRTLGDVRTVSGRFDLPDVIDGARGVRFIEKTVESARQPAWVSMG
jgi:predicted dehydrogenase